MYKNNQRLILKEIIEVLNMLDSEASLQDIYSLIEHRNNIDLDKYKDYKSVIRKQIYMHASECDLFKGKYPGDDSDLFYATKAKGEGVWGLR